MVAILAGAAASPRDAPGWVRAIGMAETGVAAIGMAATGAVVTGMGIGVITVAIMSSSSAISAFQGGGAGAGDIHMDTAMGIRTATTGTDMAIRTDTAAMVTEGLDTVTTATVTAMDMATVLAANTVAANTALRLGRG
jgi:hypothetical protein